MGERTDISSTLASAKRAFGVQYHPEASPGPMDSFYLFEKIVASLPTGE